MLNLTQIFEPEVERAGEDRDAGLALGTAGQEHHEQDHVDRVQGDVRHVVADGPARTGQRNALRAPRIKISPTASKSALDGSGTTSPTNPLAIPGLTFCWVERTP